MANIIARTSAVEQVHIDL